MSREFRPRPPTGLKVEVRENEPFAKALSRFKRKVNDSGILKELQEKQFYVKPSIRRKEAAKAARRRWQKYVDSQQLK
jgi:small subunit ribosomal protein S21